MTALRQLIEAVEACDFPRNLDELNQRGIFASWNECYTAGKAYGGSLDAAKALHEALLPGWGWLVGDKRTACVSPPKSTTDGRFGIAEGNPARAWLIAILKAYEAQQ